MVGSCGIALGIPMAWSIAWRYGRTGCSNTSFTGTPFKPKGLRGLGASSHFNTLTLGMSKAETIEYLEDQDLQIFLHSIEESSTIRSLDNMDLIRWQRSWSSKRSGNRPHQHD